MLRTLSPTQRVAREKNLAAIRADEMNAQESYL